MMSARRLSYLSLLSLWCLLATCFTVSSASAAEPLHVHLISGSTEYQSEASLKKWAEQLEARGVEVTASWGTDGGKELPNLEPLKDADLMVVFARRNKLSPEQLAVVKGHWEAGKPVIGIRTASHAFDNETNKVWDREILGGAYAGHLGDEEVEVTVPDGVKSPVLMGVEPWTRKGKLYKNDPEKMPETATVLLYGTGQKSGKMYPVVWVNTFGPEGTGKAFSTSMGLPEDWENPQFQRLMWNAVQWTTGREVEADMSDSPLPSEEEGLGVRALPTVARGMESSFVPTTRSGEPSPPAPLPKKGEGSRNTTGAAKVSGAPAAAVESTVKSQMPPDEDDDRGPLPTGDPNPDPEDATGVEVDLPERPGHLGANMDYGLVIASSLDLGKGDTLDRAFTVKVPGGEGGGEGGGAMVYDPDRMRVAAAWRVAEGEEFLDLSKTHHKSMKGSQNASPGGEPQFRLGDGAGWAAPEGVDAKVPDYGPLPKAWVDFHGHYMHGDRLILAYGVGGREVLESPTAVEADGKTIFARDILVEAGEKAVTLQIPLVAHGQDPVKVAFWRDGKPVEFSKVGTVPGDAVGVADTDVASSALLAAVQMSKTALDIPLPQWSMDGNNLRLTVLPGKERSFFRLLLHGGDADFHDEMAKLAASQVTFPDFDSMTKGGERRWREIVKTGGSLGEPKWGYAADEIKLPESNPYGSWVQVAGLDFLPDGRLIASTLNGDVWLVDGLDDELDNVTWQRFATGLYEPLGVHVRDGEIYVSGRDRITRLHDLNNDGEADFYESFYDGGTTSPGYHAFTFGVTSDKAGNFYIAKSGRKVAIARPDYNCVVRITPDGKHGEPIAWGFRHPNGLAMGPNDELLVSDNQGEWVPCGKQSLVKPGQFYGYTNTDKRIHDAVADRFDPDDYIEPLFYIDHNEDNSSGQAAWADAKRWGPLSGNLLHTTYGKCQMFYVLQGEGEGGNAAVVPMPWRFKSGVMRAATNPADGSVFVGGLKGWDTKAVEDASLSRVRYTGDEATLLTGFDIAADSVTLRFNRPLDKKTAGDAKNYDVLGWNYRLWSKYGSPGFNPKTGERGKLPMEPQVEVAADGKSVTLRLPGLVPMDQLRIAYRMKDAEGDGLDQKVYLTLHEVGERVRQRDESGL